MTAKKRINTTVFYIVAIALAVVAMVPFVWMIATSFKSRGALMSIPIEWIPKEPTWDAYIKVFSKFPFARTIVNSLFISVTYTAITLISLLVLDLSCFIANLHAKRTLTRTT